MKNSKHLKRLTRTIFVALVVYAQTVSASEDEIVEEVVVVGKIVDQLNLLEQSKVGSRLGLSPSNH